MEKFQQLNPDNVITAQVDILAPTFVFDGVKNRTTDKDRESLLEDAKSQGIALKEPISDGKSYLCSVLSLAIKLPSFDSLPLNDYSYLNIRVPESEE